MPTHLDDDKSATLELISLQDGKLEVGDGNGDAEEEGDNINNELFDTRPPLLGSTFARMSRALWSLVGVS